MVDEKKRKQILTAINEIGENIATIKEIEKRVPYERHALSKYLHLMKKEGYVNFQSVGKAKVWSINKAPLKTMLNTSPEKMTFIENLLMNLVTHVPTGIMIIDSDFNIVFMNDYLKNIYGDKTNSKLYKAIFDYKNPLRLRKIIEIFDKQADNGKLYRKDRYENILRIKANKFISPNNKITVLLIIEDVTNRTKTRKSLRTTKRYFKTLMNNTNNAIIMTDFNNDIIEINEEGIKMLDYKRKAEILGKNIMDFVKKEKEKSSIKSVGKTTEDYSCLCTFKKKKGDIFKSDMKVVVVRNKKGNAKGLMYIFMKTICN
ncbi:PAS domain S-box protein [Candidatus Woesearchaeota archaeon]|nr:PAS domain S-box protein [Candidatus Woesearchaeota archaeon]